MTPKPDFFVAWFVLCAVLALSLMAAVVFVAAHFIGKFW